MKPLFISAIGTDIGKTYHMCQAISCLKGESVNFSKPMVTGFESPQECDTYELLKALDKPFDEPHIDAMTPFRFQAPLTPSHATTLEQATLDYDQLIDVCRQLSASTPTIIEGVGGVMSPITQTKTSIEWIRDLQAQTVLVAGTYLGALSHTLCTLEAMASYGVLPMAVIVNQSKACVGLESTLESLQAIWTKLDFIACKRGESIPASYWRRWLGIH